MFRKYIPQIVIMAIVLTAATLITSSHSVYADLANGGQLSPNDIPQSVKNNINAYDGNYCDSHGEKYQSNYWISQYNGPTQTSVTVPSGTTDVNLQLNLLDFVCDDRLEKPLNGASYAGLPQDSGVWSNAPTDWSKWNFTGYSISGGSAGSSLTNTHELLDVTRILYKNMSTRYWFDGYSAPFTYHSGSGINTSRDITINLSYIPWRSFNSGAAYSCIGGGGSTNSDGSGCPTYNMSIKIHIDVTPPPPAWNVTPSSKVSSISGTSSKTVAKIGSTITWQHTVNNNGPDTSSSLTSHYQNRTAASITAPQWSDITDSTGQGGLLRNGIHSLCLDGEGATLGGSGITKAWQYTCNGTSAQLWKYYPDDTLRLAGNETKCLNATGNSDGAAVNIVQCAGGATQQKWNLNDPLGRIASEAYPSRCLDADTDTSMLPSKLWTCHAQNDPNFYNQYWQKGYIGTDTVQALANKQVMSYTSTYKVTAADAGKTLCRATSVTPQNQDNGNWLESTPACVTVPYDFTLVPATNTLTGVVQPGDTLPDIIPSVTNTGTTSTVNPVSWQLTKIVVSPTGTITSSAKINSSNPCATFGNSCAPANQGNQVFAASPSNVTTLPTLPGVVVPLGTAVGTKFCFALSVQPYSGTSASYSHSAPTCVVVGKEPQVQVLGGDLIVGRGMSGGAPSQSSKVVTSLTIASAASSTIPAPSTAFSGLWLTGVDGGGNKLAKNASDSHWIIDRVVPPVGIADSCQYADTGVTGSPSLKKIPATSSASIIPARTILEGVMGGTKMAAQYTSTNTNITGSPVSTGIVANNGQLVWDRTSPDASWIGINMFGQNYSKSGCEDPTFVNNTDITKANTYVFKLKNGMNIDPAANVNLDTVRLKIGGGVDNQIKFVVNGVELGGWQTPGWASGATATSDAVGGVFKNGNNKVEIYVRSTYSHTGLLIDDFSVIGATAQTKPQTTYGSWGEYGIIPTGGVIGMASGAMLAGGSTTSALCSLSLLTFTNDTGTGCAPSSVGGYNSGELMPDIASRFPIVSSGANATPNITDPSISLTGMSGLKRRSSGADLTISGGTIAAGRWVVINAPTTTVKITGDINYDSGTLHSINDIPQVIIIAKNIIISDAVKHVDSWLIASGTGSNGTLNTCAIGGTRTTSSATSPNATECADQLTINGPVQANHLILRRTYGAATDVAKGTKLGTPGEVFNLRADAYLWASAYSAGNQRVPTVSTKELPPRF